MHTRRALLLASLLASTVAACASPRYVGSIGRNNTYSNRGFGVTVDLNSGGVLSRWQALDPSDLKDVPLAVQPKRVREPLDLDGDGYLQITEATVLYRPALRLIARTSSVATMDLDVQILGSNNATVPLDALVGLDLKRYAGSSTAAVSQGFASIERTELTGGVKARIAQVKAHAEAGQPSLQLLVADVPNFVSEEGLPRRHIVRLVLRAPTLTEQMRQDFKHVVAGLLVAPKGAPLSKDEQW